jgi:hypothetical protein
MFTIYYKRNELSRLKETSQRVFSESLYGELGGSDVEG